MSGAEGAAVHIYQRTADIRLRGEPKGPTLLAAGGMDGRDTGRVESQKFECSPDPGCESSRRYPSRKKKFVEVQVLGCRGEVRSAAFIRVLVFLNLNEVRRWT